MATNIEIKARVDDLGGLRALVEALSDAAGEMIYQEDVFFRVPKGRLKLRILSDGQGQLIYYEREDVAGPKQSTYIIHSTSDPASLQEVLTASIGVRGIVRKRRLLYKIGNTRIHLDQVEGAGSFMELEVVLGAGETPEQGRATAAELMDRLEIAEVDLVGVAYVDLLEGNTNSR